jgi:acyl-CoA synthetase (AMP-forming)/AMP-acid ligase II
LRGPHITKGYWNNDAANLAGFSHDEAGQLWLRTGDLGMLTGDRLYVVGRLKDQVIVRGVNYSAEEIEAALCQSDPKLRDSPAVVFNSGNDLVALIEMRLRPSAAQDFALLAETANVAVTRAFGLRLDRIVFWKWGALARTTSGKIRRHAVQVAFDADISLDDLIYEGVYKS